MKPPKILSEREIMLLMKEQGVAIEKFPSLTDISFFAAVGVSSKPDTRISVMPYYLERYWSLFWEQLHAREAKERRGYKKTRPDLWDAFDAEFIIPHGGLVYVVNAITGDQRMKPYKA